jgi:putative endonuclease
MPSARSALGAFGEVAAAAHLQRRGAAILARNWRCSIGEIDLVARTGDQLLFVEVRTRRAGGGATPEESIGPAKAARLLRLAYAYLDAAGLTPEPLWRIDVIAVEVGPGGQVTRLEQIEGAVEEV